MNPEALDKITVSLRREGENLASTLTYDLESSALRLKRLGMSNFMLN